MSTDDGAVTTAKPFKRPRCSRCGQIVSRNQFDKCLWCGEAVPEELRFTDDERIALSEKQMKQKKELIAKETKKIKDDLQSSIF